MVLDNLGESLRATLSKISSAGRIDPALVKEVVRDIQRALLQADVNVKLTLQLTKAIERRALNEAPPAGMSQREHVIRIVHDEMVAILGENREIKPKRQTIMLVGLYGQGKTTTTGKLAKWFMRKGLRVGLIAADVHRPAAVDQLKQLADRLQTPFYGEFDKGPGDAPAIVQRGMDKLQAKVDIVIVDTAGRHSLDDDLVQEIEAVHEIVDADEKFLVIDAQVGQQAGPQARTFDDAVDLTGVVLTKLDGSAKGGGALSAVAETGAPIVYVGVGEGLDDLEKFDPTRFMGRLLGMGDLQSLLEKAQEVVGDEQEAEEKAKKLMSGKFDLEDLMDQMDMLNNMGPMKKVLDMLPGMGGKLDDKAIQGTQKQMRKFRTIMDSMTKEERKDPDLLKASRIERIARGSGHTPDDVKALIAYYNTTKRAMKGFGGNRKLQRRLMKQLNFEGGDMEGLM